MQTITPENCIKTGIAATIGMFDGVHLGHRCVLSYLKELATARGLQTGVITFSQHPQHVLHPNGDLRMLMTLEEKLAALAETGIDYAIVLNFNMELAKLSAREFLQFIKRQFSVNLLIVGYDHHFGHDRNLNFPDYQRIGAEIGVEVMQTPELDCELGHISSSVIRKLIDAGEVEKATERLSKPFKFAGEVVRGLQNGRKINFPTANIDLFDKTIIVPANGVYAVWVYLDGKTYGGMLNIGVRPTIDDSGKKSIEVNIFDFDEDIYGHSIEVAVVKKLRDERKMNGLEGLKTQLAIDKNNAIKTLKEI